MKSELGPIIGNKTLGDFMSIKVTPTEFTCDKSAGTAHGTYNVVFKLNKKGAGNPAINELYSWMSDTENTLEVEFIKVGCKWKISEFND